MSYTRRHINTVVVVLRNNNLFITVVIFINSRQLGGTQREIVITDSLRKKCNKMLLKFANIKLGKLVRKKNNKINNCVCVWLR